MFTEELEHERKLCDVYNDRIPRWRQSTYPLYIVDSCAQTLGTPFRIPGAQTLAFEGETSFWCSWSCPTTRETVAINFAHKHLNQTCTFVVKITGKYYTPDLIPQIAALDDNTTLVVQKGRKSSEIFGMHRQTLDVYLKMYKKSRLTQEGRLQHFVLDVARVRNESVVELRTMKLYNHTRRSDGAILHYL